MKKLKRVTSLLMSMLLTVSILTEGLGNLGLFKIIEANAAESISTTENHWYGYGYDFRNSGLPAAYDMLTGTKTSVISKNFSECYSLDFFDYYRGDNGEWYYCMQLGIRHYDTEKQMATELDKLPAAYKNNLSDTQVKWLRHVTIYGYQGTTHYGYNDAEEYIATQMCVWSILAKYYKPEQTELGTDETKMLNSLRGYNMNKAHIKDCWQKLKSNIRWHHDIPAGTVRQTSDIGNKSTHKLSYNPTTNKYEATVKFSQQMDLFDIPKTTGISFTKSDSDGDGYKDTVKIVANKKSDITAAKTISMNKVRMLQGVRTNGNKPNLQKLQPLIVMAETDYSDQNKIGTIAKSDPVPAVFALGVNEGNAELQKQFLDIDGNKVTASTTMKQAVSFQLVYTYGGKDYYVTASGDNGSYTFTSTGNQSAATTFKTDSTGKITVKGLPTGTYTWKELATYPGYSIADDTHFSVKSGSTSKVTVDNQENTPDKITITKEILGVDGAAADMENSDVVKALANVFKNCGFRAAVKMDNGKTVYLIAEKNPAGDGIYTASGTTEDVSKASTLYLSDKGKLTVALSVHPETKVILEQKEKVKFEEITAPQDLGYYKNNYVAVNADNTSGKMTNKERAFVVYLEKTDAETGDKVDGAEYTMYAAEDIYNVFGEKVYSADEAVETITTPTASFSGVTFGKYYVKETAAPEGYLIDETRYDVEPSIDGSKVVVNSNVAVTTTVKSAEKHSTGKITVYKYDKENTAYPLEGAEFGIFATDDVTVDDHTYKSGDIIESITTGADGSAVTTKDYPINHNFEIKEIKAPANYNIADESKLISLKYDDVLEYVTASAEFYNEYKQGKIIIYKTDNVDHKKYLEGAEFKVTAAEDVIVAGRTIYATGDTIEEGIVTDISGRAETTAPLYVGFSYTVTETKAPTGYSLNAIPQTVNLIDDGATFIEKSLVFENTPWDVPFELTKIDMSTKEPVPNCGIRILNSNKEEIQRGYTDENGKITFKGLTYGSYYFQEFDAPEGYLINEELHPFFVTEEGRIVKDTLENVRKTGSIKITKRTEGNLNVGGIKFILSGTSVTGAKVNEIVTTDENGTARFDSIPIGKYKITEDGSSVPTAYLVADEQDVVVSYNTEAVAEFYNAEKTGSVKVVKTTEGQKNISGIKFILSGTSDSGREIVMDEITNADGIANFTNIPVGKYEIYEDESTVPAAYLVADKQNVTVTYNNEAVATFENAERKGSVTVKKITEGQKNVENIRFTLKGISDSGRDISLEATTDADGIATFENIPVGSYTVAEDGSTVNVAYLVADSKDVTVKYNENTEVSFENIEKAGSVKVVKTTEGNLNIANIKFVLSGTSDSGREINLEALTDENGIAHFENIPVGNYTISEDGSTVPAAYLVADSKDVTVSQNTETEVSFENVEKVGSVKVVKTTEGNLNIANIKFILSGTSDSGREIDLEALTDENGVANFTNIPVGTYTITEDGSTVPTAYLVADKQTVTVTEAATAEVNIKNEEKTGTIKVHKTTEGNYNIANIKFFLKGTSDSGREINIPAVTDKDGVATFENIPIGTYLIIEDESTVPYGYLVADDREVTVTYAETVDETVLNLEKTGAVKIHKTTEGNFNIEGITFILSGKSDTGRDIEIKAVTDKDGVATFSNVPIGTYTITEDSSTVPYGYLVADDKEVTVTYAETVDETILNQEKTGSIKVQKKTSDMTNIDGIKFILRGTSDTGREIYLEATSDANGVANFTNVPIGTYTITEDSSTVPYGYLVADDKEVTVNYAETVDTEFYNDKTPDTPKTGIDANDGRTILLSIILAGAVLTIAACKRKKED